MQPASLFRQAAYNAGEAPMQFRPYFYETPLLQSQVWTAVGEVELYLTLFITSSGGV